MAASPRVAASRIRTSSSVCAPATEATQTSAENTRQHCFMAIGILSRVKSFRLSMKHALVTGGAGFIGSHVVDSLLADGWRVTVFDNFDPFYNPALKEANVRAHESNASFTLVRGDLRDAEAIAS